MYQMSKKMFNKFRPVIAAPIASNKEADPALDSTASTPSPAIAAEAEYILGIAMGYARNARAPASTTVQPHASIHGWMAKAGGPEPACRTAL